MKAPSSLANTPSYHSSSALLLSVGGGQEQPSITMNNNGVVTELATTTGNNSPMVVINNNRTNGVGRTILPPLEMDDRLENSSHDESTEEDDDHNNSIINNGFNVNSINSSNNTVLSNIKRKISMNGIKFPDWDPDVKEKKVKKFVNACSDGNLVQATKLFREGVDINAKDRYDEAALYNAANEGHYNIVKFLVKNGANIDEPNSGSLKQTALWIASYNGKFKVVRRLLKMGANKHVRCSPYIDNTSPEEISKEQCFQQIADYIREFDYSSYIRIKNNKKRFKNNLVSQQKQLYSNSFIDISVTCPYEGCEDYYVETDNQSSSNASSAPKKRPSQSNTNLALEPFSSVLYIRDQPFYIYQCDCCDSSYFTTMADYDHQLLHNIDAFNKKSFVPPQHPRPESITNILFNHEFLNMDEDILPPIECPDFDVGNGKWFFKCCVAPYEEIESLQDIAQFFQPCILPMPIQYCGEINDMLKRYHQEDSSAIYSTVGDASTPTTSQPRKKVKYDS